LGVLRFGASERGEARTRRYRWQTGETRAIELEGLFLSIAISNRRKLPGEEEAPPGCDQLSGSLHGYRGPGN
jgi:hypothetical protein